RRSRIFAGSMLRPLCKNTMAPHDNGASSDRRAGASEWLRLDAVKVLLHPELAPKAHVEGRTLLMQRTY
ncbi:MAG TPA: hypothetical protein VLX85_05945, partial [Stellaceae bacterium]|nr:hypothetical protein [Stellaceae bacterium]